jgi:hypothetical protein
MMVALGFHLLFHLYIIPPRELARDGLDVGVFKAEFAVFPGHRFI